MKPRKVIVLNLLAAIIICLAIFLRLLLITLGWPAVNSDEGTMGLIGMHIFLKGEHPTFFYGQNYMGTLEAVLAAVFFRFFGIFPFTLRLGLLVMLSGFFTAMYQLTKKLYSQAFAVFSIVLLALGSQDILIKELTAVGGAVETLFFGALLFLISVIITTESPSIFLFFLWGIIAGEGVWSHLLIVPWIVFSGLLLLISNPPQMIGRKGIVLLVGVIIGSLPLINYNLHAAPGQNSIAVFTKLHQESGTSHPAFQQFFPLQLKGAFFITLPLITGANPICITKDAIPYNIPSFTTPTCVIMQVVWPLGVVLLWIYAVVQTTVFVFTKQHVPSGEKTRKIALTRLLLLGAAGSTFFCYCISPAAALYSVTTARYLTGLLIATPAIIWPLWEKKTLIKTALLICITLVFFLGTVATFGEVPATQQQMNNENNLIKTLIQMKLPHIYSEYWTCNKIIFLSREKIICDVVNGDLNQGQNRYPAYQGIVAEDPNSAYVFPKSFIQNNSTIPQILSREKYSKIQTEEYVIYKPIEN